MLSLFTPEMRRNPYPLYARFRQSHPLLHEPASSSWMAFDYPTVKLILTDHERFSSAVTPESGAPGKFMIFRDPPRHTKLRALISKAFTPRAVVALEPRVRALAGGLLEMALPHGRMDMARELAIPLPLMVIAEMLGVPAAEWPQYRRWSDAIVTLINTVSGDGPEAAMRAIQKYQGAHLEMQAYLVPLLDDRRGTPRDDLLSRLVHAEVDGERLAFEEILGFFELLLLAGHETTTNAIDNAVLTLSEHPDAAAWLREEPGRIPVAVEEVLRYRSPVQAAFRLTREEVELHGQRIPAGQLVMAMIGSANRDPAQFPDADRFDPSRTPNPHVAFGHGIHYCVGAPLARLETRIALELILERMQEIALVSPEWEPREAFHVHGPTSLQVTFAAKVPLMKK